MVFLPLLHALYLVLALIVLLVLIHRFRLMPLLALMTVAAVYGWAQGEDPHWFAKEFGQGFGQTLAASGLAVLAGAMVAALAERSGGSAWLRERTRELRETVGPVSMAAPLALLAGLGGSTVPAYAMIMPVIRAVAGTGRKAAIAAGMLVGTGQACLIPAPAPIAAMAILGADWRLMLAFGIPAAVVHMVAGLVFLHNFDGGNDSDGNDDGEEAPYRAAALGLLAVSAIAVVLLILSSFGQMPSEPFGPANIRERILGSGRPLILVLAGVGVMLAAMRQWRAEVISDTGWLGQAATAATPVLLLVGAAGGFQMILTNNGMAELLANYLLAVPAGILLPFTVAALGKALHGSSLTAAIAAAGMMQPLADSLGLGDPSGRALMAVAIGVGAMAVPHINDGLFWLVGDRARLGPGQALKRFTLPVMVQTAGAMAFLIAVSVSR